MLMSVSVPFRDAKSNVAENQKGLFFGNVCFFEEFEGERAEHSEAKTSQCDVFSERVAETYNSAHTAASVAESFSLHRYPFGTPKKWKHKPCFRFLF